jgi:hypothetical protein
MVIQTARRLFLLLIAMLALHAMATPRLGAQAVWPLRIQQFDFPARPDSFLPQLTVQEERAILSWIELVDSRTTLWFSERTATGWSEARSVASGEDWFITESDVPSVIRLDDGTLAASWPRSIGDGDVEAYDLQLAFSKDGGRTWSAPTTPHHDGTKTQHGFPTLFQAPGAGLGIVWLDGRATTPKGGAMGLRAAVFDRAGKQISETLVAGRVCECCPTTVGVTADGPVVAFRNRTAKEIRDIYVSRLIGGKWTPPTPVHNDGWEINGCPVNGPALSARGRDVAVAWFTAQGDEGRSFVAFSGDAGRTFGAPVRLDEAGSRGRVAVELLQDGSAVASWIEGAKGRSDFRMRRVPRAGKASPPQDILPAGANPVSGYPRMVRRGNELLFAWTDSQKGIKRVRTAIAPVSGLP